MIVGDHIEGVLLDIDDTLVDTRGAFTHALAAVRVHYLPHIPDSQHGEIVAMWRADANGHYGAYTRGEQTADEQRMARANELHAAFGGAPLDAAAFEAWNNTFMTAFAAGWKPFPEARQVVDQLREHGYRIGALTNAGEELQRRKMALCGLEDVDILVTLDTFGVGKPDPRVFHEAARMLGTQHQHTLYVGDELDVDARGAKAAGLRGIWLDRPGTRRGGVHVEDRHVALNEGIPVISALNELFTHHVLGERKAT